MEPIKFSTEAAACKFEIMPATDGGRPSLTGYCVVFNQVSVGDSRRERMAPGGAVMDPVVMALAYHDPNLVLGTTANGSLVLTPDDYGIRFTISPLPDTNLGRDVFSLIRDHYISGMSFRMVPIEWKDETIAGEKVRTNTKFRVTEVSVVVFPAFEAAFVTTSPWPALLDHELLIRSLDLPI